MDHDPYSDACIREILKQYKRFAMVGASPDPMRTSHGVMRYLLDKGYSVVPVNPGCAGQMILGQQVYPRLADIPHAIDVVDVFRRSEAAFAVTEEAIAKGAKVVWMQLGVRNDAAARLAEAAGLQVVMDRCPRIEYERLLGAKADE